MSAQRPAAAPPPAPTGPPPTADEATTRRPLQFGMRTLLIVVTIVALLSPLLAYVGVPVVVLLLTWVTRDAIPVMLLTAAVFSRGQKRTFFAGAAVPAIVALMNPSGGIQFAVPLQAFLWIIGPLAGYVSCGFLAVATHRFVERRGWNLPDDRKL